MVQRPLLICLSHQKTIAQQIPLAHFHSLTSQSPSVCMRPPLKVSNNVGSGWFLRWSHPNVVGLTVNHAAMMDFPSAGHTIPYALKCPASPSLACSAAVAGVAVLLHDTHYTSQEWVMVGTIDALVHTGYRVIAVDLPGARVRKKAHMSCSPPPCRACALCAVQYVCAHPV